MQVLYDYINSNTILLVFILCIICFLLVITNVICLVNIGSLNRRLKLFFGTDKNKHSIEAMLIEYISKVNIIDDKYSYIQQCIDKINKDLSLCIQKVGIVRYNPFEHSGGDLSFAVALLDGKNKGIVFNTLHNRDMTHTYAKSVEGLENSSHPLSNEEQEAIRIAMNKKQNL